MLYRKQVHVHAHSDGRVAQEFIFSEADVTDLLIALGEQGWYAGGDGSMNPPTEFQKGISQAVDATLRAQYEKANTPDPELVRLLAEEEQIEQSIGAYQNRRSNPCDPEPCTPPAAWGVR